MQNFPVAPAPAKAFRRVLDVPAQAQDDSFRLQPPADERGNFVEPRQPRRGVKFENERCVVTVEHQARPAVALAVDEPIPGGAGVKKPVAAAHGGIEPRHPPCGIKHLRFAGVQYAHADG